MSVCSAQQLKAQPLSKISDPLKVLLAAGAERFEIDLVDPDGLTVGVFASSFYRIADNSTSRTSGSE